MKKLTVLAVVVALAGMVSVSARAESGSDLEISGNVTTVSGWQRANSGGSGRQAIARGGVLGDNLAAYGANGNSTFGFAIDQVEIDLAKSFGENIRTRADLDFSPLAGTGSGRTALFGAAGDFLVEQAYVTANVPAGNGAEFLIGRFNSGIGLDPVDRNELKTVSFSMPHRVILPHNLTGVRLGYDFSEMTRGELFVVNNLGDFGGVGSVIPSGGFNVVYNWGEEGNKSWVKFTGAVGPEHAGAGAGNKDYTLLGDLSGASAINDALSVGLEAFYRMDGRAGTPRASKYVGGTLSGTYAFSDVWDGTLRYSLVWDVNGGDTGIFPATAIGGTNTGVTVPGLNGAAGVNQKTNHEITLATGYMITDGARFNLEGRVDVAQSAVAGTSVGFGYGLGGSFAYSF